MEEQIVKIYDISMTMEPGMMSYPGDPPYEVKPFKQISKGDSANVSIFSFGSHTGTHLDSRHHILGDHLTLDRVPVEKLIAKARVFESIGEPVLTEKVLCGFDFKDISYALFKTDNSEHLHSSKVFNEKSVFFDQSGAEFLVSAGVFGVGLDSLSVDRFHSGTHPAHRVFLEGSVVIIEGVDLFHVPAGDYTIFIGLLKIWAADGAPARIFLVKDVS